MINRLIINGLKSIDVADLEVEPLTLLVGMNSSGKSTVIQALLLAIQNVTDKHKSPLNGQLVAIGTFAEASNFRTNARNINLELGSNQSSFINLDFEQADPQAICNISRTGTLIEDYLNRKNKKIQYLSANRLGAQDTYSKNYSQHDESGVLGEYAIDYFENHKKIQLSLV